MCFIVVALVALQLLQIIAWHAESELMGHNVSFILILVPPTPQWHLLHSMSTADMEYSSLFTVSVSEENWCRSAHCACVRACLLLLFN